MRQGPRERRSLAVFMLTCGGQQYDSNDVITVRLVDFPFKDTCTVRDHSSHHEHQNLDHRRSA